MKTKRKALNRPTPSNILLGVFLGILALIMAFPFYYMLVVSVGTYDAIQSQTIYLWPTVIDFSAYRTVFESKNFISSFFVSVFITLLGTFLGIVISVAGAYPMSKKNLAGNKMMFYFVIITMLFSGGTIPTYLVIQRVGLGNNILAMVLPTLTTAFNIILLKNFFEDIPPSVEESARIDGANDMCVLFRIVLPMSVPVIATICLFLAVGKWNEYFNAMLHIIDQSKKPLQLVLREVIMDTAQALSGKAANVENEIPLYTPSLQMATVTIATLPILIVYPFLQKYFTAGIMLGAVKE